MPKERKKEKSHMARYHCHAGVNGKAASIMCALAHIRNTEHFSFKKGINHRRRSTPPVLAILERHIREKHSTI